MPKMIAKAPTRICVMARALTVDATALDAGILKQKWWKPKTYIHVSLGLRYTATYVK